MEWIELAQDRYDNGLGCGGINWIELAHENYDNGIGCGV
jgi:hypothetical protein